MKRFFALLVAALLLISAAALAEGATKVYEVMELGFLGTSDVAWYKDETFGQQGLIAADGTRITEPLYLSLKCDNPWGYVAAHKLDELNGSGLIGLDGREITPFEYGDIRVLSEQWAICTILEETTSENATHRALFGGYGSGYYRPVEHVVYDMKAGKEAGRLPAEGYDFAVGYDGFIIIEDKQEKKTVYDENFQALGEAEYTTEPYVCQMNNDRYDVKRAGDGQVLFTSEYEIGRFDDVSDTFQYYKDGYKGILDMQGNELMPAKFANIIVNWDGYAFGKEDGDSGYGIVDKQGQTLTEYKYDEVYTYYPRGSSVGTHSMVFLKGYASVRADDKIGFVNEQGEETLPPAYATDSVDFHGNSLLIKDTSGKVTIAAADGVVTELPEYAKVEFIKESTDGRLLMAVDKDEVIYILDWHGNTLGSFKDFASYSVTASSTGNLFALKNNGSRMMEVYQLSQGE